MLRTAPCFQSLLPKYFDLELHSCLSAILNVDLDDDSAWAQATLPIEFGGIGVRNTTPLAPSAFLASAAGSDSLTDQICHLGCMAPPTKQLQRLYRSGKWVIVISLQFPLETFTKGPGTSRVHVQATLDGLLDATNDPKD